MGCSTHWGWVRVGQSAAGMSGWCSQVAERVEELVQSGPLELRRSVLATASGAWQASGHGASGYLLPGHRPGQGTQTLPPAGSWAHELICLQAQAASCAHATNLLVAAPVAALVISFGVSLPSWK